MRCFTDSPYEKMMMQRPRQRRERPSPAAPKGDGCIACEWYKKNCSGPCYRDLISTQNEAYDAIGDR